LHILDLKLNHEGVVLTWPNRLGRFKGNPNEKKFEKKIMKLKGKKKVGLCFAIHINCTCGMYIKDKINMKKN
jgi:hypothetical protein